MPLRRMGSESVGGGERKLKGWWGRGCRDEPESAFMAAKLSSFSVIVSMADICKDKVRAPVRKIPGKGKV